MCKKMLGKLKVQTVKFQPSNLKLCYTKSLNQWHSQAEAHWGTCQRCKIIIFSFLTQMVPPLTLVTVSISALNDTPQGVQPVRQ